MKLFSCANCGHILYFENALCGQCGTPVGYDPRADAMPPLSDPSALCANAAYAACNWRAGENGGLCLACSHNETIPNLEDPDNLGRWQTIERAKKRLFYSLVRFGLPLRTRHAAPETGLAFRFLADEDDDKVMTGHVDGIVTIALVEADDATREARRSAMGEPYRTLLGHFRHEIAHYYWDVLVKDGPMLAECRAVFGDDSRDYEEALKLHYAEGAPEGWQETHVSSYATTHAWEDFAETWAHFFHIVDTIETAAAFGVHIAPETDPTGHLSARIGFDPYAGTDIARIVDHWVPLGVLLNNLNRSVGHPDAYPFVLTPAIIAKLGFVARLIHAP